MRMYLKNFAYLLVFTTQCTIMMARGTGGTGTHRTLRTEPKQEVVTFVQGKIGYSYDAAGNRVKREIVMSVPKAMTRQQNFASENKSFSDMISDHSIKIYPNPTEGNLRISIPGLKDTDVCFLDVYTIQGMRILTENVTTDNTDINISNQSAGVYLLKITINNTSTTWKIIKK